MSQALCLVEDMVSLPLICEAFVYRIFPFGVLSEGTSFLNSLHPVPIDSPSPLWPHQNLCSGVAVMSLSYT